ncbi:hypothetical protein RND71_014742 [Anisodus tanguticus]|uniref:FAS1 domain-containing protein n=1 Tax=Anisodus tanguticus TaxID=243964 RepID=A0AAE1VFB0_9SOLA|nr:hypothetical protein RND71_014742 [Anisodus tanguticus]
MANLLLLTLFLILSIAAAVNSKNTTTNNFISPHELEILLRALRYNGYPLFSNSIDTSDVQFQILTGHTTTEFTIFAPRDHFLYTLDMATDADAYMAALRSHNQSDDVFVTVDGVRVSDPDPNLYVGSRFVIHGLDGILLTGLNMYEDTLGEMWKWFFAPVESSQNDDVAMSEVKNGAFSRVVRKQRKLQNRRIWRSSYSVRRSNGEDDF